MAGEQALLHFPVAQFDLPALAVQIHDLVGGKAQGVGHRSQDLAHLALDRLAEQACLQGLRQVGPLFTRLGRGAQADKGILAPQAVNHLILGVLAQWQ
ncbi:hypothetical protein D3C81_1698150 [compost metagenome]